MVNATIFGNMANIVRYMDMQGKKYRELMDIVNEHMRYLKVPE